MVKYEEEKLPSPIVVQRAFWFMSSKYLKSKGDRSDLDTTHGNSLGCDHCWWKVSMICQDENDKMMMMMMMMIIMMMMMMMWIPHTATAWVATTADGRCHWLVQTFVSYSCPVFKLVFHNFISDLINWIPHTATAWVATTADGRFLPLRLV